MMAVSLRYLNRIPEALAVLDRLQRLHPGFSRLYQERGHCFVALRDAPRAIDAFLNAVNLNPALPASWRTLQTLYRMTGQAENAEMAAGHVAALERLPVEIVTATALFSDGELVPAEAMTRAYLLKHGNHIEAMRLLARIGLAHDVLDDADILLEAVLELAPDYRAARYDYAMALLRRHKHVAGGRGTREAAAARSGQPSLPNDLRHCERGSRRSRTGACAIPRTARRCAAGGPRRRAASVGGAFAQGAGSPAGSHRCLPCRGGGSPELRRCLLEPCQPQDLSVPGG